MTILNLGSLAALCMLTYAVPLQAKSDLGTATKLLINTAPKPDLQDAGFASFFDGKSLAGWTPPQGFMDFEVRGREIVGTCGPVPSTFLCADREYVDFIFTYKTLWKEDGDSVVQVRSRIRNQGNQDIVFGPQVEMEDLTKKGRGWSGGIYGQQCGGWLYLLKAPEHKPLKTAIDRAGWNRMTVMVQGNVFKTWINGLPAAHWVDEQNEYPKELIGSQVHGGKQGVVHWRNLKVKEIWVWV